MMRRTERDVPDMRVVYWCVRVTPFRAPDARHH